MTPTRKVVQIAAWGEGENTEACLFALADDGTVWASSPQYPARGLNGWLRLPSIPQPEEPSNG